MTALVSYLNRSSDDADGTWRLIYRHWKRFPSAGPIVGQHCSNRFKPATIELFVKDLGQTATLHETRRT